jgi:hypothetical protein
VLAVLGVLVAPAVLEALVALVVVGALVVRAVLAVLAVPGEVVVQTARARSAAGLAAAEWLVRFVGLWHSVQQVPGLAPPNWTVGFRRSRLHRGHSRLHRGHSGPPHGHFGLHLGCFGLHHGHFGYLIELCS